ncbi:MAG: hypothetical protein Q7J25_03635 [Vicinamibacterales bacterium]|nr:hypothetical protein [Vicinamibacterales bacterium]
MATYRVNLPDLYLTRLAYLDDVLMDEIKVEDGVVPSVFSVRDMGNRPMVRTTSIASFGQVPIKVESANVTYDELAQGYDVTYQADTYELAFKTSKEALDDEQEESVSDAARALGASMTYTYNLDHANQFINGFSSTTGSPDGSALFATGHALVGGGTNANRAATDADLSTAALREALNVCGDTVDDAGKLIPWTPQILLVPRELSWLAKELIHSTDRSDTADRATNVFKDDGLTVVSWQYLTDPDAWFLLDSAGKHWVRTYWRERPNVMHDFDFEATAMKEKIRARWKRGWSDYRRTFGSAGA